MKNILMLSFILLLTMCKSQDIYPLNKSAFSTPTNGYFKDVNSEFSPYVGVWKTSYQNNNIMLVITKDTKRVFDAWDKSFYKDALIVKYEIKNSSGQIIHSTLNNNYNVGGEIKNMIMSLGTNLNSNNEVNLLYVGNSCNEGMGDVTFKKIDATHFSWTYIQTGTRRDDITCPPNLDYNVYIPKAENLVFTKQ